MELARQANSHALFRKKFLERTDGLSVIVKDGSRQCGIGGAFFEDFDEMLRPSCAS
jgi:hypothetical protein